MRDRIDVTLGNGGELRCKLERRVEELLCSSERGSTWRTSYQLC